MTPEELEALTYQDMPEAYFEACLRSVFQAHEVAWKDCRAAFAVTEAENVVGYYRRGKLEGYLRDSADRFPQLRAQVGKADNSNWNHTEIHAGSVILTENSVQTPCALVDKAEFRLTLAESSQLSLWDKPRPADAPLYILLLHSRSKWTSGEERKKWGYLPQSAYIAFPSPDLEDYVHEINLFEKFPNVVQSYMPKEWDTQAQVTYLQRSSKVRFA